jgi:hypothetical protein
MPSALRLIIELKRILVWCISTISETSFGRNDSDSLAFGARHAKLRISKAGTGWDVRCRSWGCAVFFTFLSRYSRAFK